MTATQRWSRVMASGLSDLHRVGEHRMQVAAVKHEMRRAEAFDALVAEVEPVPGFAGAPVA